MTRWSRLFAGGIAAVAIAGSAPWLVGAATADQGPPPPSGDEGRATSVSGNAVTCADVGFPNDTQFGADNSSGSSGSGFTVTSDGQNLTLTTIPAGTTIDTLIVKGGDAYNQYGSASLTQGASGFHAPLVGGDKNVPTISHWFLCYGPAAPAPQVTPPTASATGICSGADVVLNAGSSDTTFVVTPANGSGVSYLVTAGQSQTVHVDLDAAHPSVSVTVNGSPIGSGFTRGADCDTNNGGGGGNNGGGNNTGGGNTGGGNNTGGGDTTPPAGTTPPGGTTPPTGPTSPGGTTGGGTSAGATVVHPAVAATKACGSGITLTLTNANATGPVTYTLTGPSGSSGTVTVAPNQAVTRSFSVAEDTTAHVTATTTGFSRTVTYHKDCTQVLGVKHVRHPASQHTQVLGKAVSKASILPFTGFGALRMAVDGATLIAGGLMLLAAGRRRRAQRTR